MMKHTGRILTWRPSLSTTELRAFFPQGKHEFSLSTYQGCILLLFNQATELPIFKIQKMTNIAMPDLRRHIISLFAHKILLKSSKGKEINDEDVVTVNENYHHKLYKIQIHLLLHKEKEI